MIQLASYLQYEGGLTQHARGFARALNRYERTELLDWAGVKRLGGKTLRSRWRRLFPSDSVGISLGAIDRTPMFDTRYRVAFCAWETTRIPEPTLSFLRRADMVWTMSSWGREILEAHGVPAEKIGIVPAGVDTTRFVPARSARPADSVFRFLCVAKWEERKGTAGLVRSFAEEFDAAEPVELVLHCGTAWRRERDFRREVA